MLRPHKLGILSLTPSVQCNTGTLSERLGSPWDMLFVPMIHGRALGRGTSSPAAGEAQACTHTGARGRSGDQESGPWGSKGCSSSAPLRLRLHETPQPVSSKGSSTPSHPSSALTYTLPPLQHPSGPLVNQCNLLGSRKQTKSTATTVFCYFSKRPAP